ncbi:UNVERIFIED_CONTAM: hypothetical protein GTU68_055901 [Idotea baltica]|nr:hypothetical protein [Idotea baltica]
MARFGIAELTKRFWAAPFPLGTLIANCAGCFLMGLLLGSEAGDRFASLKFCFGVGFLGALTTFSTFGGETIAQIDQGRWTVAIGNVLISVIAGLLLVVAGMAIGKNWAT